MDILSLLSQIICWVTFLSMIWTVIKSPPGLLGGIIWFPKLLSSAWSPVLVVLAFLGTIIAGVTNQYLTMVIGFVTIFLGALHILKVTIKHHQFDEIFGFHWEERIPVNIRTKFRKRRYQLIQPPSPHSEKQLDVKIGISEKTGKPLLCDIHLPISDIKRSGVGIIYLHAGAWQAFDKGILVSSHFDHLCELGHLVLDLAYSLAPEVQLNQMLLDVRQAILWLKSHTDVYEINPDRIILMGASGGAHLALLTAYGKNHPAFQGLKTEIDCSVRAVISLFAVTDMSAYFIEYGKTTQKQPEWSSEITEDLQPMVYNKTWLDRLMTKMRIFPEFRYGNMPGGALLLVNLLGGTLKEIPEVYKQASPICNVHPNCPATLLIYAQDDFFVDASHGQRLLEELNKMGVPSLFIEVPETVHSFNQFFGTSPRINPGAQTITYDIERFLALMV